ncbi:Hypothetical predicted protein [Octopus vulgaris]|uniref:Uncharacterized protein n=2 Tax=Octopus TaxID=6643 RepID=A0AA36AK70_OCTVU|nr:uncharacterized protein LOC115213930 [Octopus sinensis]XP_029638805.1 uncharacterized protein LOC115213930 [Octopus sinensis]XP_036361725.1 uncharacterized protein LOC115213930 [Octopus sinensis]CAI9716162.1 Hypothetical predicted protein [Octopus vulgaris]
MIRQSNLTKRLLVHYNLNRSEYVSLVTDIWLKRQRSRDAIWSFLCVVFLLVLMMWGVWYYGLCNRKSKRNSHNFEDTCHYTTVNKVIQAKAKFLPMFQKKEKPHVEVIADNSSSAETDYEDMDGSQNCLTSNKRKKKMSKTFHRKFNI